MRHAPSPLPFAPRPLRHAFPIPTSRRGVGAGPYGPEATFQLPNSIIPTSAFKNSHFRIPTSEFNYSHFRILFSILCLCAMRHAPGPLPFAPCPLRYAFSLPTSAFKLPTSSAAGPKQTWLSPPRYPPRVCFYCCGSVGERLVGVQPFLPAADGLKTSSSYSCRTAD